MAETPTYDWSGVTGQAVERLRAPKITPVPDKIRELAQLSYDGKPFIKNGKLVLDKDEKSILLHVLRHRFGSDAEAAAFAKAMRKAGDHTTPLTSVSAVVDPDRKKDMRTVSWKAGTRRGKQVTV